MAPLKPSRRSELRAQAHRLNPLVIIGDKGLTDEVVAEIDRTLKAHELIKVKAATDDREARREWMSAICERLEAHPVQQIGKVLVIYRENPKEKPTLSPGPSPKGEGSIPGRRSPKAEGSIQGRRSPKAEGSFDGRRSPKAGGSEVTRTSRLRSRTTSPRPASAPRRRRPRTSR